MKKALAKASERMPSNRVDKQIQLVHAQHRIGELVPARMTLGRLIASNTSDPEVLRLQSMLDLSFQHLSEPALPIRTDRGVFANSGADVLGSPQNRVLTDGSQPPSRTASDLPRPESSGRFKR